MKSVSQVMMNLLNDSDFPQFAQLPKELRVKVWYHTLESRKVVIRMDHKAQLRVGAGYKNPVALHICSESREEALKSYRLCFQQTSFPLYISPTIDMVHIRHGGEGEYVALTPRSINFPTKFWKNLSSQFDWKWILEIRQLAIDRDLWLTRVGSASLLLRMFSELNS
jgi:hypothetical protein